MLTNLRFISLLVLVIAVNLYPQSANARYPVQYNNNIKLDSMQLAKSANGNFEEIKPAYTLRKPDDKRIKEYLEDDELNYKQNPDIETNWFERAYDWIKRQIQSIMQSKVYSTFIDYLIYIIMIAALLIIIVGSLKSNIRGIFYGKNDKKLSGISEEIEDLSKIDFNDLIQQALEKNDYKLAIRYNYLKILTLLSKIGVLDLREFKTSSQLVNEFKRGENYQKPFKFLTNIFEKTWYGDYKIEQDFYNSVKDEFNSFEHMVGENE